jgi:hypothetical protein
MVALMMLVNMLRETDSTLAELEMLVAALKGRR